MLSATDSILGRWFPASVVGASALVMLALGATDYATGFEISFSLFYLLPVGLSAWCAGMRAGTAMARLSGVGWVAADLPAGHVYSHPAIPFWNALVRLGIFLLVAFLLAALHGRLLGERRLARTDALTGLENARAFWERLECRLAVARRTGKAITLVYADVDEFKRVNDAYGHAGEDRMLQLVAGGLRDATRRTDIVARMVGDEFALVLPDADGHAAREVASKFRGRLASAIRPHGYAATCSIGAMTFRSPPESADDADRHADHSMCEVKTQGRDAVAFGVVGDTPAATGPEAPARGRGSAAEI